VKESSSSGLFSQLKWGKAELLLHTEISPAPDARVTTLLMSDGEVLCRAAGRWGAEASDQVERQRLIGDYHERLLRALARLRDERGVDPSQLAEIFQRLVDVALRRVCSPADELLASLPGARWVALIESDGSTLSSAPEGASGSEWRESALRFLVLAGQLRDLFGGGSLTDVSIRTHSGHILVAPYGRNTLVTEVELELLGVARRWLRDRDSGGGK